jgi:hypothetical protein
LVGSGATPGETAIQAPDELLLHRPAYPVWSLWAAFDDVGAAVSLDRFLRSLSSTAMVVSARQISSGELSGKRTIVLGQPRFTPLLVDLLAEQDFRPPKYVPGKYLAGFVNVHPKPASPRGSPISQAI